MARFKSRWFLVAPAVACAGLPLHDPPPEANTHGATAEDRLTADINQMDGVGKGLQHPAWQVAVWDLPINALEQTETCYSDHLMAKMDPVRRAVAMVLDAFRNNAGNRKMEVVETIIQYQFTMMSQLLVDFFSTLGDAILFLYCPGKYPRPLTILDQWNQIMETFAYVVHDQHYHILCEVLVPQIDAVVVSVDNTLAQIPDDTPITAVLWYDPEALYPSISQFIFGTLMDQIFASMINDFADFFAIPNFLPADVLPANKHPRHASDVPSNIFDCSHGYNCSRFTPEFVYMLNRPLRQISSQCNNDNARTLPTHGNNLWQFEDLGLPRIDMYGAQRHGLSVTQIVELISRGVGVGGSVASFVPPHRHFNVSGQRKCNSRDWNNFDPTACLREKGWGGYVFEMEQHEPFNMTSFWSGRALGSDSDRPFTDVHGAQQIDSLRDQQRVVSSNWKSTNWPSPDVLYFSQWIGNCVFLEQLIKQSPVVPKVIYTPFNPLVPPPLTIVPDFLVWFKERIESSTDYMRPDKQSEVWMAQCSLQSISNMLEEYGYVLLQVDLGNAVFVRKTLWPMLQQGDDHAPVKGPKRTADTPPQEIDIKTEPYDLWREGWRCQPMARYFFNLEMVFFPGSGNDIDLAYSPPYDQLTYYYCLNFLGRLKITFAGSCKMHGVEMSVNLSDEGSLMVARKLAYSERSNDIDYVRLAAFSDEESPLMQYFMNQEVDGARKGQCVDGLCECFPPWRGSLCSKQDLPYPNTSEATNNDYKAVIHFMIPTRRNEVIEIAVALQSLWGYFNKHHDYPVIVFHEGLPLAWKREIVSSSNNRIWFILVAEANFKKAIPKFAEKRLNRAEGVEHFGIGYRAMCRWRSGIIFQEKALDQFDYAMTLDTDSYFPGPVHMDPFKELYVNNKTAMFPHLARESAAVVVNLLHHYLLYAKMKGYHPRSTQMLKDLNAENFKWYQQVLALDIEILKLDFFRGEAYQDFFRYMDATGGFWLYRWGNNPFRTFAVATLLKDDDVVFPSMSYAHQEFCRCGEGSDMICVKPTGHVGMYPEFPYHCLPPGTEGYNAPIAQELGLADLQPWYNHHYDFFFYFLVLSFS